MESTRDIFNKACVEIAETLANEGFEYRQSRHTAVKKSADLTFEISFQSSRRNFLVTEEAESGLKRAISKLLPLADLMTFGNVTLIEHAVVRSKTFKKFRQSIPAPWSVDDVVSGGQIGNLQSPTKWIQFNLANPGSREKVIAEAKALIQRVGLPYLDSFDSPESVVSGLLDGSMPWVWEPSALEYVCCFGSKKQARSLLARYINESSSREAEFVQFLQRYKVEGTPEAWESTAGARLAKAAVVLGLDIK